MKMKFYLLFTLLIIFAASPLLMGATNIYGSGQCQIFATIDSTSGHVTLFVGN